MLLFLLTPLFGRTQDKVPLNQEFGVHTSYFDNNGEWLYFLNDTTCIHTYGSLVWGTETDTLACSINDLYVQFYSAAENTILNLYPQLTIERTDKHRYLKNMKKSRFRKENFTYTIWIYPINKEFNLEKEQKIITLKIDKYKNLSWWQ